MHDKQHILARTCSLCLEVFINCDELVQHLVKIPTCNTRQNIADKEHTELDIPVGADNNINQSMTSMSNNVLSEKENLSQSEPGLFQARSIHPKPGFFLPESESIQLGPRHFQPEPQSIQPKVGFIQPVLETLQQEP